MIDLLAKGASWVSSSRADIRGQALMSTAMHGARLYGPYEAEWWATGSLWVGELREGTGPSPTMQGVGWTDDHSGVVAGRAWLVHSRGTEICTLASIQ